MPSFKGAMQGLGAATEAVGFEALRAAILAKRDEVLNSYQGARDDKLMAHQSSEAAAGREHQTNLQDRGFTHAEGMQDRALEHQTGLQERGFEHAEGMQDRQHAHAKDLQQTSLEHAASQLDKQLKQQASEGDKNRQVQREGQSIQAAQVQIAAEGAKLDREIKTIQVENAKEVKRLQDEFGTATDPARKEQIRDRIQLLTGKDNDAYLPVPIKDESGAITGYQIFDKKSGRFVSGGTGTSGAQPTAADIAGLTQRKDNPAAVQHFEKTFGPGSAQRYLGGAGEAKPKATAPANPNAGMQAQLDFDADAASISPQALVAKYSPLEAQLKLEQVQKLNAARQQTPKRALPFGRPLIN